MLAYGVKISDNKNCNSGRTVDGNVYIRDAQADGEKRS